MNTASSSRSAPTAAMTLPSAARPYPSWRPGRRPRRHISRDSSWAITAVPVVTVAVAMPPHGVSSPRMSWTTKAPTVTAAPRAAAPTIWPAVRTRSTRRCSSARSASEMVAVTGANRTVDAGGIVARTSVGNPPGGVAAELAEQAVLQRRVVGDGHLGSEHHDARAEEVRRAHLVADLLGARPHLLDLVGVDRVVLSGRPGEVPAVDRRGRRWGRRRRAARRTSCPSVSRTRSWPRSDRRAAPRRRRGPSGTRRAGRRRPTAPR